MRFAPLVMSLACLPVADGGLFAANDALTAMDFPAERVEERHAHPEVIVENDAVAPGGTAWIGVRFKIEEGWHLYWNGRNDSGSPPTFSVSLPTGYTLGEWQWPAPKRHRAPGDILDHIYEGSVLLMAPLKIPADAKVGTNAAIKIDADWVVCDSNVCVAESGAVEISLPIKEHTTTSKDSAAFADTRTTHPKPWPTASKEFTSSVVAKDSRITTTIRVEGATMVEFYPSSTCPEIDALQKKGSVKGESLVVTMAAKGDQPQPDITGVVAVARNGQQVSEFYALSLSVPKAAK